MYFLYDKSTGYFAGCQEQSVDTDQLGSTTVSVPNCYDADGIEIVYQAKWTGTEWELVDAS